MVHFLIIAILVAMTIGTVVVQAIQNRKRANGHPACGSCGYDVTGIIGVTGRCPECGAEFAAAGIIPPGGWKTPQSRVALVMSLAFLIIVIGLMVNGAMSASSARRAAIAAMQQARQQAATLAPATTSPALPTAPADQSGTNAPAAPLTQSEVDAMTLDQARRAIYIRAIAEKNATDQPTRDRLRIERRMLIARLKNPN